MPPPQGPAWKAHGTSIVSIDLAEAKELVITASTDCCVRLWSKRGRYIGEVWFVAPEDENNNKLDTNPVTANGLGLV